MEDPNQLGITIAIAIVIIAGAAAVTLSFLFGVGAIWQVLNFTVAFSFSY